MNLITFVYCFVDSVKCDLRDLAPGVRGMFMFAGSKLLIPHTAVIMTKTVTTRQPQQSKQRYSSPKSGLGKFLWRKKMWVESTFALTMLERWEKILIGQFLHLALS
jgi:Small subunit of serine palmitoyltransferase-like